MENQPLETADAEVTPVQSKSGIALPLLGVCLTVVPLLTDYLYTRITWETGGFNGNFITLLMFFIPVGLIAGLVIGIVSLVKGKGKLSTAGKVLAISAIVLPIALIIYVAVLFVGASMGLIQLM